MISVDYNMFINVNRYLQKYNNYINESIYHVFLRKHHLQDPDTVIIIQLTSLTPHILKLRCTQTRYLFRQSSVLVYSLGKRTIFINTEPIRSQDVYDNNQHTVHSVADHVLLRQHHRDIICVLDADGTQRRILRRAVFLLRRRGVRAQTEGSADVSNERLLLRWLVAVHVDIRDHIGMEADRAHWHVDPNRDRRYIVYGQMNI